MSQKSEPHEIAPEATPQPAVEARFVREAVLALLSNPQLFDPLTSRMSHAVKAKAIVDFATCVAREIESRQPPF